MGMIIGITLDTTLDRAEECLRSSSEQNPLEFHRNLDSGGQRAIGFKAKGTNLCYRLYSPKSSAIIDLEKEVVKKLSFSIKAKLHTNGLSECPEEYVVEAIKIQMYLVRNGISSYSHTQFPNHFLFGVTSSNGPMMLIGKYPEVMGL